MEGLLTPFIGLAAIGLVLSIVVHASAIIGIANPLVGAAWALHGAYVVIPILMALVTQFPGLSQWLSAFIQTVDR